ncbi:MAG: hypothetical protein ACP5JG_17780 [Anaerolineae bacterium]
MEPNIFSTLARYSGHAEENYLTESLVFVARLLLERDPARGLEFANLLCCQDNEPWFTSAPSVQISTQVNTPVGTPDIELRNNDVLVYVEVKHDSPLGIDQLERYKEQLDQSGISRTRLVLLSRSRYSDVGTSLDPSAYQRLYWYNIYNWLSDAETDDEVSRYFCDGLIDFLEEKNMSMKKVGWEYINGVPAMLDLTEMMEAAVIVALPDASRQRTGGWFWRGFYVSEDLFFGFRFSEPLKLVLENNKGNNPKTLECTLDLEAEHFFSLTNNEQLDCLVKFLLESTESIPELRGTSHSEGVPGLHSEQ